MRLNPIRNPGSVITTLALLVMIAVGHPAAAPLTPNGPELTLQGSLFCNGASVPKPKPEDHGMVLYALDGTPEIRAEVEKIMRECYPDQGLDAEAAERIMGQFTARLKYFIWPQSPALPSAPGQGASHYCQPAAPRAVTGEVFVQDGKSWINARKIEPVRLSYPAKMLAPDQPFVTQNREPRMLQITDKLTLRCVAIPPGKFLMGTPFYMWPYYVEEYPHLVTLTKPFYLAEIPVTQEMYEAVMGYNPSTVKDPQLPVQDPRFAEVEKFCAMISSKNGCRVRLPTDAEWEYAARVGTSNPGFPEKFQAQNSSGPDGFKTPLKVKSKAANPWGLYDLASCWWEITADRGMYNARQSEVDPRYPPAGPDLGKGQRSGRGIIKDNWSISTHEFITEKGYAGQKFRLAVEADMMPDPPSQVK
jgi:formylglycine-generating enzyme required for sulfatase activity